jgi:hypothetical protein
MRTQRYDFTSERARKKNEIPTFLIIFSKGKTKKFSIYFYNTLIFSVVFSIDEGKVFQNHTLIHKTHSKSSNYNKRY